MKILAMVALIGLMTTNAGAEPQTIRESVKRHAETAVVGQRPAAPTPGRHGPRRVSPSRKALFGVVGGIGGFFAGGFLGAKIEGSCGCDDPGLKGFLIGAPIGAVVGASVGVALAR